MSPPGRVGRICQYAGVCGGGVSVEGLSVCCVHNGNMQ